jgi:outer membrane receptor protein involved in Fe transport
VDNANTEDSTVDSYYLVNLGINYAVGSLTLSGKINNLLDALYITHGESWGAYWPGATRSIYMEMKYQF